MDKELKELQEVICCGCPCYVDDLGYQICEPDMKTCDIEYCDTREAFNKVKAAYKNVKKDLAGRQKKITELMACHAQMKAESEVNDKEGDWVFIPKGHGRIIDEAQIPDDRLAPSMDLSDRLSWAPTILKADEEEESEV